MVQQKLLSEPSSEPSPQPLFWPSLTTPDHSASSLTLVILLWGPFWNNLMHLTDGIWLRSFQSHSFQRSAIMKFAIKSYLQSSMPFMPSDTTLRDIVIPPKSGQTTQIWSTSVRNRNFPNDRPSGPFSFQDSNSSSSTNLVFRTSLMHCPGIQIIKRG